jgi:membrane associated rhomboid family serine protease
MFIPVGDITKRRTTPFVNYLFILANVAVFAYVYFVLPKGVSREEWETVLISHALKPDQWMDLRTFFTSMFLHGDLVHLLGNMLFLWIAGDNVEDRLGHVAYGVFYFLAGIAGAAVHVVMALGPIPSMAGVPTVGASGAISGVLGAYLVFFPTSKIKFMIWLILFVRYFTLPSWGAIGLWLGSQLLMARNQLDGIGKGETMNVAVFAHLGGFAFGFAFAFLARLFGKSPPKPAE